MRIDRRSLLQLMGAAAIVPAASRIARAETYPSHPVHIIVGQASGSSSDITARLIGQFLTDRLGQQFVVEDRPGAGGNIATDFVMHAPADGYTMLLVNAQNSINAALYGRTDFVRDIAPVGGIFRVPLVMEVHPSFPAKTVAEFIAYAKANPGKINMASAGNGGPQHLAGELFKFMAGVDMVHVPYRGSTPALVDLLAGQVQVMFDVTPSSLPHLRAGKLRALAITTTTRSEVLPDVAPLAEFVPGYEASAWIGFGVPRNTPAEAIEILNTGINAAISDDKIKARLADLGGLVLPPSAPADFGKLISDDIEKWTKVVKFAGLKPE
ncbi:MAG TPA: tripartite tricarboxylate transporter substrate binding protein [Xanthobacteraceae bacterium]|nr:tripartite tricarboxylate transporter substrate binding protein [Xanthobacteraceae bacterium]